SGRGQFFISDPGKAWRSRGKGVDWGPGGISRQWLCCDTRQPWLSRRLSGRCTWRRRFRARPNKNFFDSRLKKFLHIGYEAIKLIVMKPVPRVFVFDDLRRAKIFHAPISRRVGSEAVRSVQHQRRASDRFPKLVLLGVGDIDDSP